MADTTNPLPSVSEPLVDRFRRWNPVWYRFIRPLIDTVRSNGVSIERLDDSYTISINANGRVVGSVKLDGTGSTTTFAVLANKFVIVHPTDNATEIQAFITGLVNGVATVGINGNLVIDGSILARHIDVDTLSALAADIGEVTAGVLRSADNNFVIDLDNKTITITT